MSDNQVKGHDSDCSTNNRGVPELLGPCDCSLSEVQRVAHFPNDESDSEILSDE